MKLKWR